MSPPYRDLRLSAEESRQRLDVQRRRGQSRVVGAQLAAIASRGLEPDEIETYGSGVRKAVYRDPDGNEVGFGATPAAAST